jgi:hypothetical protein
VDNNYTISYLLTSALRVIVAVSFVAARLA